jgi:4-hydroxy-3-polyprenylbenzoate decarboxylase
VSQLSENSISNFRKETNWSLPGFIANYLRSNPSDVLVVDNEISIKYDTTIYYDIAKTLNPLLLFNKIKNYPDDKIVSNVLGSDERIAFVLGVDTHRAREKWNRLLLERREPKVVNFSKKFGFNLSKYQEVDLGKIPVPIHFSQDGSSTGKNRYITGGLAVARNPNDDNIINMSFTRIQLISKNTYAFDLGSHGHMWRYIQTASKLKKPLEITVLIGAHPIFYLLAAAFLENEYSVASAYHPFVFSEGINNKIPFPICSQYVIEADIQTGYEYPEGPFSEFTGYVSSRTTGNLAKVKTILRKRNPIYYDIIPSNSTEHVGLFSFPRDAQISESLTKFVITDKKYEINWPRNGSHFVALISLPRENFHIGKQIALSILGLDALFTKFVIVKPNTILLNSLANIFASLADSQKSLLQAIHIIPDVFQISLDPTSLNNKNGKAIIIAENKPNIMKDVVENQIRSIKTPNGSVEISAFPTNQSKVTFVVPNFINLRDDSQLFWALATRVRPHIDISFNNNSITINAKGNGKQEVPSFPVKKESIKKINNVMNEFKKKWHHLDSANQD